MRYSAPSRKPGERRPLAEYIHSTGQNTGMFALHATNATGEQISSQLLKHIEAGQPIAPKKAQAICDYLSKEFGRTISIEDVSDLKLG